MNIAQINIELTNKCDKRCYFCGRHPQKEYGEIDRDLLTRLSHEIHDIQVQFHRDGEPLMYSYLDLALQLFSEHNIVGVVTNGKKLIKWAKPLFEMANTIVISAFLDDPDQDEQYRALARFMALNVDYPSPIIIIKWVGDGMDSPRAQRFKNLGVLMTHRQMHGVDNGKYEHSDPPIPEMGICQDLLLHPSIDWRGNVHLCQRKDPDGLGIIGNLNGGNSLKDILNGERRETVINAHKRGARHTIEMCRNCGYWGYPNG